MNTVYKMCSSIDFKFHVTLVDEKCLLSRIKTSECHW